MLHTGSQRYGDVSWNDIAPSPCLSRKLTFSSNSIAIVLAWSLFKGTFMSSTTKRKSWRRILGDSSFRFIAGWLNMRQLQYCFGTSLHVYETWARKNRLPILVEEIGTENVRLLWVGPRRTDRVVIFFHGGGYVVPLQDFSVSFWNYVRLELGRRHLDVGFAILNYSLVPTATFPTQLIQAVTAVKYIIDSGVEPRNIQIVGDSAGGNLALAFLAHMLHPLDSVPRISLTSRISGVYLMSPWVSFTGDTGSHMINDNTDVVGAKTFAYCGRKVMTGVPESLRVYLEASKSPGSWFKGIDELVKRILVSAGGAECLRDDIIEVAKQLSRNHQHVELDIQEGSVHNDPYYDFFVGEKKMGDLTPRIVDWLEKGFKEEDQSSR
ncbi:putative steryl acetyl hydrolase mug81 [Hypsizygus marmoreus]|uniref:Steryl acetyl hydrolase mug81 n=1 Tax=Hypsizygus marmoreus TaxID=39966 RepID=A0A369JB41_HYPMA|nr:putative steryl acetyl hydrolase mug81 [Hypsizygus marmoreus]